MTFVKSLHSIKKLVDEPLNSQKPQMRPFGDDFIWKKSMKVFSSILY